LREALEGRLAIQARLAQRVRSYRPLGASAAEPPVRPTVRVDNELSQHATVIEIEASDGIGVLYRITRAIADLDLDVRSAKVQTLGRTVVDSFYLRDRTGAKVTDERQLAELERAIVHALTDEAW